MFDNELIFILDLDGTIIGNCMYQSDLYFLQNIQKKYNIKILNNNNLIKSYNKDSNLIRPYFMYFYNNIFKYYPNTHIFIYTASQKKWAYKEIEYIEKQLNIKFSRPIFTREDCLISSDGSYKKLISKILPKLKRKINNFDNIKDNLIIIDNNNIFLDYLSNFILCKSYEYIYILDIWDNINIDYYNYPNLNKFITKLIKNNKIHKYNINLNYNDNILEKIYKWKYKKYKKINKNNKFELNDIFWKKITDTIINNDFKKFNKDTINYLQKIVNN